MPDRQLFRLPARARVSASECRETIMDDASRQYGRDSISTNFGCGNLSTIKLEPTRVDVIDRIHSP